MGEFVLHVFVCVCVVDQNPKTPNLSPMADDAITCDDIRGLGSLVYIYGSVPNLIRPI